MSPPNLLKDGSFECQEGAGWSAQSGDFALVSPGRSGKRAAQVTANATGQAQFGFTEPLVARTSSNAYCVNAWVKGSATDMRMEVLSAGAGTGFGASGPVKTSWLQVPASSNLKVQVPAGGELYLRFRILNGQPQQTLEVDDIDAWESASGNCMERH